MPSWDLPSFPSENTRLEAAPPQCSRAALCRRVELGGVATQLQRDRPPPCWLCLLGGCRAGIHPQFTIPACLCHRSHIQQLVARVSAFAQVRGQAALVWMSLQNICGRFYPNKANAVNFSVLLGYSWYFFCCSTSAVCLSWSEELGLGSLPCLTYECL